MQLRLDVEPMQYDNTASLYVVRHDTSDPTIVLRRRKPGGTFKPFGGTPQKTLAEDIWETAQKEMHRESDYMFSKLGLLQPKEAPNDLPHPLSISILGKPFKDHPDRHPDPVFAFTAESGSLHNAAVEEIDAFTQSELRGLEVSDIELHVRIMGLAILQTCFPFWEEISAGEWRRAEEII